MSNQPSEMRVLFGAILKLLELEMILRILLNLRSAILSRIPLPGIFSSKINNLWLYLSNFSRMKMKKLLKLPGESQIAYLFFLLKCSSVILLTFLNLCFSGTGSMRLFQAALGSIFLFKFWNAYSTQKSKLHALVSELLSTALTLMSTPSTE